MTLLALGAKCGGLGARGWVTDAVSAPAAPAALANKSLPASPARAIEPSPTWQRRRKWRRVTSLAYSWCRFIASPLLPVRPHGLKTRATGGAHRGTGLQPVRTTPEDHPFVNTA